MQEAWASKHDARQLKRHEEFTQAAHDLAQLPRTDEGVFALVTLDERVRRIEEDLLAYQVLATKPATVTERGSVTA